MPLPRLLKDLFKRPRVDGPEELEAFWQARAAFIAQKCVIEYCRARAGLNWQRLFSEPLFQRAVHEASWRAWRVTLLDVAEMLDATFRPHVPVPDAMHDWLREAGGRIIARQRREMPDTLGPAFAEATHARVEALLETLRARPPLPVKDIARQRAREVFDAIPIHPDLKAPDEDYVTNTLRVFLVRACDDLKTRAEVPFLARRVVGVSKR